MKKISDFLDRINAAIEKNFELLKKKSADKIPQKIKEKSQKEYLKQQLFISLEKALHFFLQLKEKIALKVRFIIEEIIATITKAKALLIDSKSSDPEKRKLVFKKIFLPFTFLYALFARFGHFVISLRPSVLITSLFIFSFGLLLTLHLIQSASKVASNSSGHDGRNPSSEALTEGEREREKEEESSAKSYKQISKKTLDINGLFLPLHIADGDVTRLKSVTLDFGILCSNQHMARYYAQYELLIRDRLNMTVEIIIPNFPLTEEGKELIKDKILKELNKLNGELNIDGEFLDIYFYQIIAG
jgi:flagellar basal body-associated protein FliL